MRIAAQFIVVLLLGFQASAQTPKGQLYDVVRVVDGDTVVLSIDNKPVKFRLIGVDTPETVHPNKPVERFGREASKFTKDLLLGKKVFIEREPAANSKDRYGRDLAYLYLENGTLVNKEIILQGFGFAYLKYPFNKMDEFKEAQQEARSARRGLWGDRGSLPEKATPDVSGLCGAMTKKGTPCKRRVKGGGHCYQHGG
jgi:micrococcal nuclease